MQKKYCVSFCPIDIIPEEYQTVCDVFSKKGLLPDKWDYVENVENKTSVDSLPRTLIVIVGGGYSCVGGSSGMTVQNRSEYSIYLPKVCYIHEA